VNALAVLFTHWSALDIDSSMVASAAAKPTQRFDAAASSIGWTRRTPAAAR
jgi:hypothetical protein